MLEYYLINLERSADRLAHFQEQMKRHGLPPGQFHLFQAIDAKTHTFTDAEMELTKHMHAAGERKTVICNFLSHYYVWCDIKEKGYPYALVLQDDVQFANGFMEELQHVVDELPSDSEIVNLGHHLVSMGSIFMDFPLNEEYDPNTYILQKISRSICTYRDHINPCSLAYIVTQRAFNRLFTLFPRISNAIDRFLNNYCIQRRIFYASVKVLATGTSSFKSTVFEGDSIHDIVSSYMKHVSA